MSYYQKGLATAVAMPQLPARVNDAAWGVSAVTRGSRRFYRKGLGVHVGARTPGMLGSMVDGSVNLLLDLFHVLLLLAGGWALYQAFIIT